LRLRIALILIIAFAIGATIPLRQNKATKECY